MYVCVWINIYDTLICLVIHMNIYTVYKYHVNIDIHYGERHGQRSLVSHSPEGCTELYYNWSNWGMHAHMIFSMFLYVFYMFCTGAIYVAFINVPGVELLYTNIENVLSYRHNNRSCVIQGTYPSFPCFSVFSWYVLSPIILIIHDLYYFIQFFTHVSQ